MKKSICMLGCAMIGVLAACSTDSAFKPADPALVAAADAAVITETEAPSAQIQQRFANELRILKDNNMKRETIKDADGSMWYCQGVYNEDQPGKPAILVFLHGIGERGDENLASIRLAVPDIVKQIKDAKQKVILLAPECPSSQLWAPLHRGGSMAKLTEKPAQALGLVPVLIQKKIKEFDADPDRVYITGLSMGGYGTWDLISRYGTDLFAAAMPCCGGGDPAQAEKMKDLPIWIFHGGADPTVPVMLSRRMYAALKEAGNDDVFYKEYPGVQHDCWTRTYQNPESWKWLFSQKRGVKSDVRPEQGEVVKVTQEEFESAGGFGGGRGGQRPGGMGQGGQRPQGQGGFGGGMGQGGQRPQGQGGFGGGMGQGGQRPQGQGGFGGGFGQGGQRPGMGQGGQQGQNPQRARDLQIIRDNDLKQLEYTTDAGHKVWYCEGTYNMNAAGKPAIILFLHGGGERGNDTDNASQVRLGLPAIISAIKADPTRKVIVLAPQCPSNQTWGGMGRLPEDGSAAIDILPKLIEQKIKDYGADPDRVYITGFSMGGIGTLEMCSRRPDLYAAAVAICCGGSQAQADKMVKIPTQLHQGAADTTVQPARTRAFYDMLKNAGGKVTYTEYPGVGHNSWDNAYADKNTWTWLFAQKRGN